MSTHIKKYILYTTVFCVGFVGVSLWSFYLITHPPRFFGNTLPSAYNLAYEEVTIQAKDEVTLSGWYIPQQIQGVKSFSVTPRKRAVLFLHGYPADKADMLSLAHPLSEEMSLLLMDMRYFGESDGSKTTLGILEKEDFSLMLDELFERGYESVGVFGFSLGGAVAILGSEKDPRAKAIAAYAPFSNPRTLGRETYQHLGFLKYPLVELMDLWSTIFFGEKLSQNAPERSVRNIPQTTQLLFIHSREDEVISFSHMNAFQSALSEHEHTEFLVLENAFHGELPPHAHEAIRSFFIEHL